MSILKLLLAPTLIGVASWVGKRWGPAVGGWFAALPLTSGPVVLVLAIERGTTFAAEACTGILLALVSLSAFALAYAWSARRLSWTWSSIIGCAAFLGCTALLSGAASLGATAWLGGTAWLGTASVGNALHGWEPVRDVTLTLTLPLPGAFAFACASLAIAIRLMPAPGPSRSAPTIAAWDIPLRMVLAAMLVWVLTRAAARFGPRVSGLLTPFPIAASILAAFTHHAEGPVAVSRLLRGLLVGLFSFALFFFAVGSLIVSSGTAIAFTIAVAGTLALHAHALTLHRRHLE